MQKKNTIQIISITTWFILLVGMILLLPNTLNWNATYSQQLPANQVSSATVVYTNPNGPLTSHQKKAIQKSQKKLAANKKFIGFKTIETTNDANAANRLNSADKSTQLSVLTFKKSQSQFHVLIPQLYNLVQVSGVKTYVTGNSILQIARAQATQAANKAIIIVSCLFMAVCLGLLFRAILAPLLALLLSGIVYLTSFSITTAAARFWGLTYSAYTNTLMTVVSFAIFPVAIGIFYYFYSKSDMRPGTAKSLYQNSWLPTLLGIIPMIVIGGCLLLSQSLVLRSMWGIAVVSAFSWVIFYTLMPAITEFLGDLLFWPSYQGYPNVPAGFWRFNTQFGKQRSALTLAGIFIFIFLISFLGLGHLNWSNQADIPFSSQAKIGATVIDSHYPLGKTSPTTLTLTAKQPVTSTQNMAILNELTQKLKSDKQVANVYSLAQPGGTAMSQLYVDQQLQTITTQLTAANLNLTNTQKSLKSSQKQLKDLKLAAALKQLLKNTDNLNKIGTQSSEIADQAQDLTNDIDTIDAQQSELSRLISSSNNSRRSATYRRALTSLKNHSEALSNDLQTLRHNIGIVSSNNQIITDNISQVQADQQTVLDDFQTASTALKDTQKALTKDSKNVQIAQQNLTNDQRYLDGLSHSGILNTLYVTAPDLKTSPMKNALTAFNQSKNKVTTVQIILKDSAASDSAAKTLNRLRALTQSSLAGTQLKTSSVDFTGQTAFTSHQKQAFSHDMHHLVLWLSICLILYLLFVSQSLFAIYTSFSIVLAFVAGLQLTHGLSSLWLKTDLLMDSPVISGVLFIGITVLLTIILISRTSRTTTENYQKALTSFGRVTTLMSLLGIGLLLALSFTQLLSFIQVAFTLLFALLIWGIFFPAGIIAALHLTYDKRQ